MTGHRTPHLPSADASAIDAAITISGLSGGEVARRLGMGEKTVRRWRKGEATPTPNNMLRLVGVLVKEARNVERENGREAA